MWLSGEILLPGGPGDYREADDGCNVAVTPPWIRSAELTPITVLRATAAAMIAPIIAWYLHVLLGDVLALLDLRAADWRFLITSFYGYLLLGFVFAGVAAKLAPSRSRRFMNWTILASVATGVILALASGYGVAAEVTIALAVVIGASGYGLRLRGFTERLQAD